MPGSTLPMPLLEHADLVPAHLFGIGVEIGAFKTPIPGIRPIYVDRFSHYAGEPSGAEYFGDATRLPVRGSSLDYVASSHLIEHVANPISAFREWCRVLKDGGIIYMVVPHRQLTFDRPRPLTPVEHMVDDFLRNTTQVDGTHIDDFVFGIDWARFSPSSPPGKEAEERAKLAAEYRMNIAAGHEINIHFHTFEPDQMNALIAQANTLDIGARVEVLRTEDRFSRSRPDGFLIIARVRKPGAPVSRRRRWPWQSASSETVLLSDARKMPVS